ncbi:YezD family protein [Paenibacillus thailandensis]|uniref:YezD family protein n=1 Tax=Paenibacillus thailandensis TaxID=393250 RepID=A0ABW5QS62_9BACL
MAKPLVLDETWLNRIVEQTTGLQYGSVVITVHDGRIVQIDRTERTRYDQPSKPQHVDTPKNKQASKDDSLRIVQ